MSPLVGISTAGLQAARRIIATGTVDAFGLWAIFVAVGLALLLLKRKRAAGTFMFYALLPIYPAYAVAVAAGWYPKPARAAVYVVLTAVWFGGIYFLWNRKVAYGRFIAANESNGRSNG